VRLRWLTNVLVVLVIGLSMSACRPPDPRDEIELTGIETYWVVDTPTADTQYIAPAVRVTVRNKGPGGPSKCARVFA